MPGEQRSIKRCATMTGSIDPEFACTVQSRHREPNSTSSKPVIPVVATCKLDPLHQITRQIWNADCPQMLQDISNASHIPRLLEISDNRTPGGTVMTKIILHDVSPRCHHCLVQARTAVSCMHPVRASRISLASPAGHIAAKRQLSRQAP